MYGFEIMLVMHALWHVRKAEWPKNLLNLLIPPYVMMDLNMNQNPAQYFRFGELFSSEFQLSIPQRFKKFTGFIYFSNLKELWYLNYQLEVFIKII